MKKDTRNCVLLFSKKRIMSNYSWILLIIIGLAIFILIKIGKRFKRLRLDNVVIVNGGVKCGKTTLCVHLALKTYKRNLRQVKLKNFVRKIFHVKPLEIPLLYSNIPLKVKYVPLTYELLLREKRFRYKSVCLLSESSLVACSNDFKSDFVNDQLTYFVKLFGHETCGGSLFLETQSLNDNHYAFKRGINRYYWIQTLNKTLPFFLCYRIREMVFSDGDGSISNNFNNDSDETMKLLLISKKVWKKFDCYTYSALTDDKECVSNVIDNRFNKNLKTKDILSIRKSQYYKTKKEKK